MSEQRDLISTENQRIVSLDVLRGIALGGILIMNIVSFGLPATAYSNPTVVDNDSLLNHLAFSFTHIFFDQKMMGLFSLLFGASVILFIEKLKEKNKSTWLYYYSRIFWLIVFGLTHSIILWQGDILFYYGLCGLVLFLFRYLPNSPLLILGLLLFYGAIFVGEIGQDWLGPMTPNQLSYYSWAWTSNEYDIQYETSLLLSPYTDLLRYRFETSEIHSDYTRTFVSQILIGQGLLRALGLMAIGMAFYRMGIFNNRAPKYLARIIFVIGSALAIFGLYLQYQYNWSIEYSLFRGRLYNHLATPFLVYAYTLFIVNLVTNNNVSMFGRWLLTNFANYGRMAFTNYIAQSAICTTIFYGYGFGYFGQFNRLELLAIALAIIVIQIIFSTVWLRLFSYGPLEWLWRVVTFFRLPSAIRK